MLLDLIVVVLVRLFISQISTTQVVSKMYYYDNSQEMGKIQSIKSRLTKHPTLDVKTFVDPADTEN